MVNRTISEINMHQIGFMAGWTLQKRRGITLKAVSVRDDPKRCKREEKMRNAKINMNWGTAPSPQAWVIGVCEGKGWRKGPKKICLEYI